MADYRYNPPPNWPAPPAQGWTPPRDWQPDPSWGPAPEGWEFWVAPDGGAPDGGAADGPAAPVESGRPNRSAWGRTAIIALISVAILAIFPIVGDADNVAEVIGAFTGRALLAYLVTAAWAFFSRKHWGWGRYVLTFVLVTLLLSVIGNLGAQ